MPTTNTFCFLVIAVGTPPFFLPQRLTCPTLRLIIKTLHENICVSFIKLPCTIPNTIRKLEIDLLKTYLKKSPFLAPDTNSAQFQAAVMLNKALLVGNSGTWRTKHPWIQITFRDGAIMAENLTTEQKHEKMPITITVPTTTWFPLLRQLRNLLHF